MDVERLEQLAAVIVTAGLVAGNFLLFTPWRDGHDPRQRHPERSTLQSGGFIGKTIGDSHASAGPDCEPEPLAGRARAPAPSARRFVVGSGARVLHYPAGSKPLAASFLKHP